MTHNRDYDFERFVGDGNKIFVTFDFYSFDFGEIHTIIALRSPITNFIQTVPSKIHDIDGDVAAQSMRVELNVSGKSIVEALKISDTNINS